MPSIRRPVMAGNWKLYKTRGEACAFVEAIKPLLETLPVADRPEVVLCAPFTALDALSHAGLADVSMHLGAQNMSPHEDGAYTGEIAPRMLTDLGVRYVILGHSERRTYFHETDADIQAKTQAAVHHGFVPIVCVGESLAQREAGETDVWVQGQVRAALDGILPADLPRVVIAYEPLWAIGTGRVCEAPEANRVIGLIRQTVGDPQVRILYGGSMKPDNVAGLLAQPEIDGGLVGGASLEADSFFRLIQAAVPARV